MAAPIVVVLTGCTRGLGRALARFFADEGAIVAGCGRSKKELERMRAEFSEAHHFSCVDVGNDSAVAKWALDVVARFNAPNLLLNNAALIAENAPVWSVPAAQADAVLRVNVTGTINVLRQPPMIKRSNRNPIVPSVIVNFSSGWGRSASPDVGIYCASKWAIEGLTQSLAQDLAGTHIRAFALNPGVIDTAMLRKCFGPSARSYPTAKRWVEHAGPFILSLLGTKSPRRDISISVPGVPLD
jgi:NAD(P)-dependent dehydrogenase (short-subunit alcohol dehydrogenase family)